MQLREPAGQRREAHRPSWPPLIWLALAGWCTLAGSTAPVQAAALRAHDPTPPTFSITNPLYSGVAQGPVNTDVQVQAPSGSTWTPQANITLSVIPENSGATCDAGSGTPISASGIIVGSDGSFKATFFTA